MSTIDPTRKSAEERRAAARAKDFMARAGDIYDRLGRALMAKDIETARALFEAGTQIGREEVKP